MDLTEFNKFVFSEIIFLSNYIIKKSAITVKQLSKISKIKIIGCSKRVIV
jgi:hypothetical protein